MKIYYDVYQYGNCLTECKVLKEIVMVGSVYCKDRCPHNQKTNLESSFVICEPQSLKEDEMKKFNLEEARNGKKVVTRDGREARYLGQIKNDIYMNVFAVVDTDGSETLTQYTADGSEWEENEVSDDDLFMATEKKTVYIGLFNPQDADALNPLFTSHGMNSRREAELYYSTCATLIEVIEREIEV